MLTTEEKDRVTAILGPLISHPRVQEMKKYIQHGSVTTYEHCMSVATECYEYVLRHGSRVNVEALVRAAFLHDFYLYDWHERGDGSHRLHGFRHARRAAANARREFGISKLEDRIIRSHMWPLTFFAFPRSREGWILTYIDKKVSWRETLKQRSRKYAAPEK